MSGVQALGREVDGRRRRHNPHPVGLRLELPRSIAGRAHATGQRTRQARAAAPRCCSARHQEAGSNPGRSGSPAPRLPREAVGSGPCRRLRPFLLPGGKDGRVWRGRTPCAGALVGWSWGRGAAGRRGGGVGKLGGVAPRPGRLRPALPGRPRECQRSRLTLTPSLCLFPLPRSSVSS